jgi:hypothetical protein
MQKLGGKNMKCGTITFHRAINYGGILQAFALQTAINKINVDNEIIDYRCSFLEELYRPSTFLNKYTIKRIGAALIKNGTIKFNTKGFEEFTKKHIKTSEKIFRNKEDLVAANEIYDIFITGSDQVWSYYCAGHDSSYFLDFVKDKSKKNSYAASFGVSEIPDNLKDVYRDLLVDFNNISVREETGKNIIRDIIGRDVNVMPDPTLLLSKSEWKELMCKRVIRDRYVLVYMIAKSKSILDLAKYIANKRNIKVIYINDNIYKSRGVENRNRVSPDEWVELFMNAECILTNSFHGIAFSINFQKEFYMQYLETNVKVNSRMENILKLFNLQDRFISNENDLEKVKQLDNSSIECILKEERQRAFDYLRRILKSD